MLWGYMCVCHKESYKKGKILLGLVAKLVFGDYSHNLTSARTKVGQHLFFIFIFFKLINFTVLDSYNICPIMARS